MADIVSENKRIAKNTLVLYVRMAVMMVISFFTARVTLNALGVTDYGINNVVGGLVSIFSLISGSLSGTVSRFITFGLGEGNMEKLKRIFSTSVNIHIILVIIVVIAIETVGVWFLNNKMVIPAERLYAANWVLQCSVVSFAFGLFSVPYNAAIIAHEKMTAFAYMTIFDAASRLAIIGGVYYYNGDKLILFALMLMAQAVIRQSIYLIYCKRKFEECTYHAVWDKELNKSMFGFAGWSFIGTIADVMNDQGVNIAINMFTGPAINAARGIAMQVNSILGQFSGGVVTSISPQITKNYASENLHRVYSLTFKGTRMSYYLYMFVAMPVLFEVEFLLQIWLGQVPEHTVLFARLTLILTLAQFPTYMLGTAQSATGVIRNYKIVVGCILLLNFPISYFLLKIGLFPEITLVVAIIISQINLVAQLLFLRHSMNYPVMGFFLRVYLNVYIVTILAAVIPAICYFSMESSWLRLFVVGGVSVISSILSIYYIGCNRSERLFINSYVCKLQKRICKK